MPWKGILCGSAYDLLGVRRAVVLMMTVRSTTLLALLAASLYSIAHAGLHECKGIGYPDLPGGFVDHGGSAIGTIDSVEYALKHVCKGPVHELWLNRVQRRDESGIPVWSTLAKLTVPQVRKDEVLVFGHWSTCERGSAADPAIVAIVKNTEGPRFTAIVRAWRANGPTSRFDAIPTVGIVCQNDGYGL